MGRGSFILNATLIKRSRFYSDIIFFWGNVILITLISNSCIIWFLIRFFWIKTWMSRLINIVWCTPWAKIIYKNDTTIQRINQNVNTLFDILYPRSLDLNCINIYNGFWFTWQVHVAQLFSPTVHEALLW